MAFCEVNGIDVLIQSGSWKETPLRSDPSIRTAFDGTGHKTERYKKRVFEATTIPLPYAEALALQEIIDGSGTSFTADESTTYTGKAGLITGTGSITAGGKYGNQLSVLSGDTVSIPIPSYTTWTVLHWKASAHYTETDDGDTYLNGAASGAVPSNWMSVGATLDLEGNAVNGTPSNTTYDEIHFVPARLTAAQVLAWYTKNNSVQFPEFPKLYLDGSCVGDTPTTVLGEVTEAVPEIVDEAGTPTEYWRITFRLREV